MSERQAIADQATARPWNDFGQVVSAGRHRIADTQDTCCFGHSGQECSDEEMGRAADADAALIVLAVNSFDAHLALEEAARIAVGFVVNVDARHALRDALAALSPEIER